MKPSVLLSAVTAILCTHLVLSEVLSSTSLYLSPADKERLRKVIEPGLNLQDVTTLYYAVVGYKLLGETIPNVEEICKYLNKYATDNSDITPIAAFHVVGAWKELGTCPELPKASITKVLSAIVDKDTSNIIDLYHAVNTLTALSQKLPDDKDLKVTKTLQAALKKDDSLMNLAYTFHIIADLRQAGTFAFDRIEDAIIQADEVDGQYLQFEGGLSVTSFVVNGIFKLSAAVKKRPPITAQQTVKLANYLLSRRSVQSPKGVVGLLSSLTTLATNDHVKPVCIALAEDGMIISNQQPLVKVKICDILGKPLPTVPKVVANSATRIADDAVVLSDESFQATSDKTLFSMNLMKVKPDRGFYKIAITAGSVSNRVTVKVLTSVTVDYLEIGTGDADQTTQPKLTRIAYPEKLDEEIEADSQQKLVIRFLLRDAANKKPMRVHQAFLRLSSLVESAANKKGHEIIFVAEPDSSNVYKFQTQMGAAAADFGHQTGDYNVELIVGDALLDNSFQWSFATVSLKFPDPPTATEAAEKNAFYKQKPNIYTSKPEIKHMFREPEKRPPAFVSNLFTGLCLAPVLLLFILWFKLGVNISNFPLSLSAITFHLGLGGIFVLFGVFWLKLNMFVTLRYLLGLGVVTFLAGNKLLSHIAQKHKLSR